MSIVKCQTQNFESIWHLSQNFETDLYYFFSVSSSQSSGHLVPSGAQLRCQGLSMVLYVFVCGRMLKTLQFKNFLLWALAMWPSFVLYWFFVVILTFCNAPVVGSNWQKIGRYTRSFRILPNYLPTSLGGWYIKYQCGSLEFTSVFLINCYRLTLTASDDKWQYYRQVF